MTTIIRKGSVYRLDSVRSFFICCFAASATIHARCADEFNPTFGREVSPTARLRESSWRHLDHLSLLHAASEIQKSV